MPRVALTDLHSIPDILSGDAFYLLIPNIPGNTGNLRNLALKCLNTQVAGVSNEKMTVALHSHQINFRGRHIQSQTLSVTYYEDQTMDTWRILRNWMEQAAGTISGNSQGFKSLYSVDATQEVYNHLGNVINTTTYFNLFPTEVPDIALDGSQSSPVQISVTFSYDYSQDSVAALL